MSVHDAAKLLNTSEKTIYRWIKQGSLPAYRLQNQFRFNRAELLEWATSRKLNVAPEAFQEADAPIPQLSAALEAGGIFYRLEGADKRSVLGAVVQTMRLPDGMNRDFLLNVLLAREAMESTAIGDGIAIPHVRNPVVLHAERPMVSLCFPEKPVEFGALDGKPVFALFSLVSPTVRAHLRLLSQLSLALRDAEFKSALEQQGSREEILGLLRKIEARLAQSTKSNGAS